MTTIDQMLDKETGFIKDLVPTKRGVMPISLTNRDVLEAVLPILEQLASSKEYEYYLDKNLELDSELNFIKFLSNLVEEKEK